MAAPLPAGTAIYLGVLVATIAMVTNVAASQLPLSSCTSQTNIDCIDPVNAVFNVFTAQDCYNICYLAGSRTDFSWYGAAGSPANICLCYNPICSQGVFPFAGTTYYSCNSKQSTLT